MARVTRRKRANPRSWQQGAFWVGMTRFADVTGENRALPMRILAHGQRQPMDGRARARTHADDHVIAQSYLWAAKHGAGAEAIAPLRATFDSILANPRRRPT